MSERPKAVSLPPLRARVVRGPNEAGAYYWRCTVRDAGKERTVGTFWATSHDEAASQVGRLRDAGAATRRPGQRAKTGDNTVRGLLGTFLEAMGTDAKPGTYACYKVREKHLTRHLGHVGLHHLHKEAMSHQDDYRRKRKAEGVVDSTVNGELDTLSRAWSWATKRGQLTKPNGDPYGPLHRVRVSVPPVQQVVPPEADILAVLHELEEGWARDVLIIALTTGLRIGEINSLTWADVRLDTGAPHLALRNAPGVKTGARRVPLSPVAVATFKRMRPDPPTGKVVWVKRSTLRQVGKVWWEPAAIRAGVPPFTCHGLRRRFITTLVSAPGANLKQVAKIVGHSVNVLTAHYLHPTHDELDDLVSRTAPGAALLDNVVPFPNSNRSQSGVTGE